ncbi:MAG: Holliday junction resolvase-like protein [Berkelbacteria bacterium GW2011_GWA1_39_10]|uniref:Holliday junction resolvase-like protein n=1 Tax=Berkelbacteria bacterium GW2011_GWA1_39_10 TaxID=1618332 RepID=A0A0G0NYD4_9BACT|nr:MAG: Holliday junction resolvase-like protein [Berkelbacteria bacterium GW2011_GWA1_39_10]
MSLQWQAIIVLVILLVFMFLLWRRAKSQLNDVSFSKSSLSSKYGKMTEQFMPFLKNYPYDPQNFRFLGTPIDGVQFENDKIILIEFKTANSQLTERQRQIAELIWQKRIEFEEHRIE